MQKHDAYKFTQYTCAVLLIVTSIALAFAQTLMTDDIAAGVLLYIAQAFLLAGSIFGLDYYVKRFNDELTKAENNSTRNQKQQPA